MKPCLAAQVEQQVEQAERGSREQKDAAAPLDEGVGDHDSDSESLTLEDNLGRAIKQDGDDGGSAFPTLHDSSEDGDSDGPTLEENVSVLSATCGEETLV